MQVLHQKERNSNSQSIERNLCLHIRQFYNKIFKITYGAILNNTESIITRYKNSTKLSVSFINNEH